MFKSPAPLICACNLLFVGTYWCFRSAAYILYKDTYFKKTKVMVMNGTGRIKHEVKLNGVPLERVTRFKYLGS